MIQGNMSDHVRIGPSEKKTKQCMWCEEVGRIGLLIMETSCCTNHISYWKWSLNLSETMHPTTPPPQKKQTWWFIEKTIPAYRVQRKQIIGPQDRCALPHCKLQAKILQPPAKQLDSCNRNIQIWGWIQLIQRRCGENQDQNFFLGVYVCSKNMKSSKHTLQEINISHPGKRKIIFKMNFSGDMLVPRRVYLGNL